MIQGLPTSFNRSDREPPMFVLSGGIGESIIIDDALVATVAVIGADFVDLGLSRMDGTRLGHATLATSGLRTVAGGVQGIMIKSLDEGRVRLGFEYPEGVSIARDDVGKV